MSPKRFWLIFFITGALFFVTVSLLIYTKGESFRSFFKNAAEERLTKTIGADVTIGAVSGNIFKKVVLYDLGCRYKDIDVRFKTAQLEYSLWDIISRKRSLEDGACNVIEFNKGSVGLADNTALFSGIRGKIKLGPAGFKTDGLSFRLFDIIEGKAEGSVFEQADSFFLDLSLDFKGSFKRDAPYFPKMSLEVKGKYDEPAFDGGLEIRLKPVPKGPASAMNRISSSLYIDTEASALKALFMPPGGGEVALNVDYSQWPLLTADVTNRHINICGLDFSNITHIASDFIFKGKAFSHIKLDINTESTVLNYYPFDELEASYLLDRDVLRLIYIKAGDEASCSGAVSFKESPMRIFLKINFSDFDVSRPFLIYDKQETPMVSGRLSGEIVLRGLLGGLQIDGSLGAVDGRLGTVDYKRMILNIKGKLPMLAIYDSRLVREDSFLRLDGSVDIRNLAGENFLENVTISTDKKTIIWEGWDISKAADENELKLSKGVEGKIKVGFRKRMSDETQYQAARPQDELELEYRPLDDNGAVQFKSKEKEEFVGVVKKYKF